MIACDICENWFHGECVNVHSEQQAKTIQQFLCPSCLERKQTQVEQAKGAILNTVNFGGKHCTTLGLSNPAFPSVQPLSHFHLNINSSKLQLT